MGKNFISTIGSWMGLGLLVLATCSTSEHFIDDLDFDDTDDLDSDEDTDGTQEYPSSCQEVLDHDKDASDGSYTLYVGNNPSKPYSVHCHDMERNPTEYLQLNQTGGLNNFSAYTAGGASEGSDVLTHYTRVRIHPESLDIDVGDQRFSSSAGSLSHSGTEVTSMPYGTAMACVGPQLPVGVANINLSGTPFTVADGALSNGGAAVAGESAVSDDKKTIEIVGGGFCGWRGSGAADPFNDNGGFDLPLVYAY